MFSKNCLVHVAIFQAFHVKQNIFIKLAEITPCASEKFGDCKVQHVTLQIVVNTFQALLIYFASLPQGKTLRVTLFCTGGFPFMVNTPE